jgi:uncharacterized membrane protein (UPF0127 family)
VPLLRTNGSAIVVVAGLLVAATVRGADADKANRGRLMTVKNLTKGNTVATRVILANTHTTRRKGLLGHESLGPEEGMFLIPCRSVHTIRMKFAIDIVFVDKAHRVVKVMADVKPGRLMLRGKGGYATLELAAGTAAAKRVVAGDQLKFLGLEEGKKDTK